MAVVRGILAQAAPAADTDTNLYTVPASKNATVKVISANRSTSTTVRVWVAINAAATADKQYVSFDQTLANNDAVSTVAMMVGNDDVIRVRAASANVTFTCTGIEQDD